MRRRPQAGKVCVFWAASAGKGSVHLTRLGLLSGHETRPKPAGAAPRHRHLQPHHGHLAPTPGGSQRSPDGRRTGQTNRFRPPTGSHGCHPPKPRGRTLGSRRHPEHPYRRRPRNPMAGGGTIVRRSGAHGRAETNHLLAHRRYHWGIQRLVLTESGSGTPNRHCLTTRAIADTVISSRGWSGKRRRLSAAGPDGGTAPGSSISA